MNKNIAKAWEERSKLFADSKKAVMEQAFPLVVNDYIENIHCTEIEKVLDNKVKKCLDVGCGYGRIASIIANKHPNIFIYGVDISPTFVSLFNNKLQKRGKAYVADIRNLPFQDNFFDVIWVVVSFMYLEKKEDQEKAMRELFRVLKIGGKIIFIESNKQGVNIVRLWGLVPYIYRIVLRKSKIETYGIAFPWKRIDFLISYCGGRLLCKRGYPLLTILLFPYIILGKIVSSFVKILLKYTEFIDKYFPNPRVSYFITYVAVKK